MDCTETINGATLGLTRCAPSISQPTHQSSGSPLPSSSSSDDRDNNRTIPIEPSIPSLTPHAQHEDALASQRSSSNSLHSSSLENGSAGDLALSHTGGLYKRRAVSIIGTEEGFSRFDPSTPCAVKPAEISLLHWRTPFERIRDWRDVDDPNADLLLDYQTSLSELPNQLVCSCNPEEIVADCELHNLNHSTITQQDTCPQTPNLDAAQTGQSCELPIVAEAVKQDKDAGNVGVDFDNLSDTSTCSSSTTVSLKRSILPTDRPFVRKVNSRENDEKVFVGTYTHRQRLDAVQRYREKRKRRVFNRVVYECRKHFAKQRPRVAGRFVKLGQPQSQSQPLSSAPLTHGDTDHQLDLGVVPLTVGHMLNTDAASASRPGGVLFAFETKSL